MNATLGGASGGTRTPTTSGHWDLNPARLPIPPRSLSDRPEEISGRSRDSLCGAGGRDRTPGSNAAGTVAATLSALVEGSGGTPGRDRPVLALLVVEDASDGGL